MPTDMKRSIFIALPKKPGAVDCEQHRTISLMSHLTKILLKIILLRIRNKLRPEIGEMQFCFVEDKGTRNGIFTLSMLMERCIEVNKDLYMCFIDYSKAFDKVQHEKLFKILSSLDIDGKDLRILRNLYWEQEAAMRVDNELSSFTPIRRGVRQGCVLSPDLFNLYSEMILRDIEHKKGVCVGGKNITNLRYADDTVLLAESEHELQELLDVVVRSSENMGLELNISKTECMTVSKNNNPPACVITSRGQTIQQVEFFKYLGFNVTSNGKSDCEIKKRIGMAKNAFNQLNTIMKSRNISMKTKIKVLDCYVLSVLLYGF